MPDIKISKAVNLIHAVKKSLDLLGLWNQITLTSNEIDIMKVIRSLENRIIFMKGISKKISREKLPLIEKVITPLAESVLILLGSTAAGSATDASI